MKRMVLVATLATFGFLSWNCSHAKSQVDLYAYLQILDLDDNPMPAPAGSLVEALEVWDVEKKASSKVELEGTDGGFLLKNLDLYQAYRIQFSSTGYATMALVNATSYVQMPGEMYAGVVATLPIRTNKDATVAGLTISDQGAGSNTYDITWTSVAADADINYIMVVASLDDTITDLSAAMADKRVYVLAYENVELNNSLNNVRLSWGVNDPALEKETFYLKIYGFANYPTNYFYQDIATATGWNIDEGDAAADPVIDPSYVELTALGVASAAYDYTMMLNIANIANGESGCYNNGGAAVNAEWDVEIMSWNCDFDWSRDSKWSYTVKITDVATTTDWVKDTDYKISPVDVGTCGRDQDPCSNLFTLALMKAGQTGNQLDLTVDVLYDGNVVHSRTQRRTHP